MIYHPPDVINHFLHTLANQIRSESGETLLLTLSSKEKNSEVYKKLETIVDKVVNLEK
jgi:hypothetical protein